MFAFGIAITFFDTTRIKKDKIFWFLIVIMIFFAILGSFSRSGLLCASLIGCAFLLRKNIKAIIPIIGVLSAGLILATFVPDLRERVFGIGEAIETGASGRFLLWRKAIGMWTEAPLFGNGFGAFVRNYSEATHNTYLQLLADIGIIGLVLYCLIIIVPLIGLLKLRRFYKYHNKDISSFLMCAVIALLGMLAMLGTLTFQDVKLFWMECGACYLLCVFMKRNINNSFVYEDDYYGDDDESTFSNLP